jgi:regulator of protease activity HflC (stomatin/prohibitin superfamily)
MRRIIVAAALAVMSIGLSGCGMIWPPYRVWEAEQNGKAELAQANQNRQIAITQSKAKAEAASFEAQSEIIRAQGVAKANKIIGASLQDNEAYLRYLFVNGLENTKNQIIYVPTEAQLPVLEAGRRNPQ